MTPLPAGFRIVRGTRLAVDRAGLGARRLGPGGWAPVDLEQDPLLARALPLLVRAAWPSRPTPGLTPPGIPGWARPVPGHPRLWATRRAVFVDEKDHDQIRFGHPARTRRGPDGQRLVLVRGRAVPLDDLVRAAWGPPGDR